MPKLSFVVPVYNPDLSLFEKCIKSLVDQSLKSWEVIFVLDGPNAEAKSVINRLMKKSPNHYRIMEQEHAGAQRARNLGSEAATGDFICAWDCDCVIEPDTAQTWVEQFEARPEIGFIYSGYKFLDEKGAIPSQEFDPWTLRVRNYVSTCFPVRREFWPGWNESLKSLQDWDFWLSAVEKGAKGLFLEGYAFSTAYPSEKSISGQGCTPQVWLERVDAVKKLHNLPEREVCVSSLGSRHEGIWLAKLIDADYQDIPNAKPHRYKTIIQVGFSFLPGRVEHHCAIFNEKDVKKVVFWDCESITELWTRLNATAIKKYRILLNNICHKQFVEDETAREMMTELGFKVEVFPLPLEAGEVHPLPKRPKFAVDFHPNYNILYTVLEKSLPDIDLEPIKRTARLSEISGLIHLHPDRTTSPGMKRAHIAGRAVVSNVRGDYNGTVDDTQDLAKLIPDLVEKIRRAAKGPVAGARDFYSTANTLTGVL